MHIIDTIYCQVIALYNNNNNCNTYTIILSIEFHKSAQKDGHQP